jgi:hypothetical protein
MTEEVRKAISVEIVEFTLTVDGTFASKSKDAVVTSGLYIPLSTVVKLITNISKEQNEGYKLVSDILRGIIQGTTALLEKK